jgi:hypothetical protein
MVGKVLCGAKPNEPRVNPAGKFDLAINMKFAKALDVADPPSILVRPDEWSNKRSRVRFGHKGKHSAFACVVRFTLQRPDVNLELARYCDMETDFHCLLCN